MRSRLQSAPLLKFLVSSDAVLAQMQYCRVKEGNRASGWLWWPFWWSLFAWFGAGSLVLNAWSIRCCVLFRDTSAAVLQTSFSRDKGASTGDHRRLLLLEWLHRHQVPSCESVDLYAVWAKWGRTSTRPSGCRGRGLYQRDVQGFCSHSNSCRD